MENFNKHQLIALSIEEKTEMQIKLRETKKSFFISTGIAVIVLIIALPYLLVEFSGDEYAGNMFWFIALPLFFVFFYFGNEYYKTVYPIILASKANNKIVFQTTVIRKIKNPTFHPNKYGLMFADSLYKKLFFPKIGYNEFKIGDLVEIEIIEPGKQVIIIKSIV